MQDLFLDQDNANINEYLDFGTKAEPEYVFKHEYKQEEDFFLDDYTTQEQYQEFSLQPPVLKLQPQSSIFMDREPDIFEEIEALAKHSLEYQSKKACLTDQHSLKQKTLPSTNTECSDSLSRFDESYEESESICGTRKTIKKSNQDKNSKVGEFFSAKI